MRSERGSGVHCVQRAWFRGTLRTARQFFLPNPYLVWLVNHVWSTTLDTNKDLIREIIRSVLVS